MPGRSGAAEQARPQAGPIRADHLCSITLLESKRYSRSQRYTTPWSSMASATFTKPAMFAPRT
jgi:hypothetical protein